MIKSKNISQLTIAIFFVLLANFSFGQNDPCIPKKPKDEKILVYDLVDYIPLGQEKSLNQKLQNFALETSNQFVVLVTNDLCGFTPNQFATELGDSWELGQKDEDNGMVLLVKPKTNAGKGEVYVATGKGMEVAVPDITAKRIIRDVMIPLFKKGQNFKAIDEGVDDLMLLAKGEFDEAVEIPDKGMEGVGLFVVILFLFLMVIIISTYIKTKNYATLNNIPFWTAYSLLNQQAISRSGMPRNRGSRGTIIGGGFPTRGSGGSSGGGFGGFGGFGGGSFGGGGAGGSW